MIGQAWTVGIIFQKYSIMVGLGPVVFGLALANGRLSISTGLLVDLTTRAGHEWRPLPGLLVYRYGLARFGVQVGRVAEA